MTFCESGNFSRNLEMPMNLPKWMINFNKRILNRATLKISGASHSPISTVCHVGRHSGKLYQTPIIVGRDGGGLVSQCHGCRKLHFNLARQKISTREPGANGGRSSFVDFSDALEINFANRGYSELFQNGIFGESGVQTAVNCAAQFGIASIQAKDHLIHYITHRQPPGRVGKADRSGNREYIDRAHPGSSIWMGRKIVNVVPCPSWLSSVMAPICISTIFLAMESPNPLPPLVGVRALSALKKRSKTRS
jgi:hypothetical protein